MKKSLHYLIPLFISSTSLISCNDSEFKGTAKTTLVRPSDDEIKKFTDTPKCVDQQKSTLAPNIALIIDNSASNGTTSIATDCPAMVAYSRSSTGRNLYRCNAPTMREAAVKSLVASLQGLASRESANPLADANIAIGSYPASTSRTSWTPVSQLDQTTLDRSLAFTRFPDGDTPLSVGLDQARLFGSTADGGGSRKTMYVFISDGFPNDEYASSTIQRAQELNANSDVFVITNTNGSNYVSRSQDFRSIMSSRNYFTENWYRSMIGYDESEGVMNELADKHFVVDSANKVPEILNYIVNSSGGIQCVDQ